MKPSMKQRYIATMVLAAAGDAIGYKGGSWQFNYNGPSIHKQLQLITNGKGIKDLNVQKQEFPYSDDTVMHIATARGLLQSSSAYDIDEVCTNVAKNYKQCMEKMDGRGAGLTCIDNMNRILPNGKNWKAINFAKNGGGCGASMRAACIGLYFYKDMDKLIEVSIQTGRITHHNPLGYLGSLVAALFTALAIQGFSPKTWLPYLLETYLPKAKQYIKKNRDAQLNIGKDWDRFQDDWLRYAKIRGFNSLDNLNFTPLFPQGYDLFQRQKFYHQFSISGWPGALGLDSVIIAYDALLSAQDYLNRYGAQKQINLWQEICLRGMLHGGDSDSTGTIVGAWYGAIYGYKNVFPSNYCNLQDFNIIEALGKNIYQRVYQKYNQLI